MFNPHGSTPRGCGVKDVPEITVQHASDGNRMETPASAVQETGKARASEPDATPRSKRPRRAPDAKREAIVGAAERIIAGDGVDALKARRLASEAGVALGTPVNLFGSLENVVAAVNARTFDRLADALDAVPRESDPAEDLVALGRAYASFVTQQPRLWGAVFEGHVGEFGTNPNDRRVGALLARLDERVTASLATDGTDGMGRDPRADARVLWGAVHGLVSLSVTGRARLLGLPELDEAVTALVRRYTWRAGT